MSTRLVVYATPEERRAIKMQAVANDMSVTAYVKHLAHKDKAQSPTKGIKESGSREV